MSREAKLIIGVLLLAGASLILVFGLQHSPRRSAVFVVTGLLTMPGVVCLIAWCLAPKPTPETDVGPIGSFVGDPDEFIATVVQHAERFERWAGEHGFPLEGGEDDFMESLWTRHRAIDDAPRAVVVGAIAYYGELVRKRTGGVWRKSRFFPANEPVIVTPGRPWTRRRVIPEVIEVVSG